MDVSDGLLLDARRMAEASRCTIKIALDELPLSSAFVAERGQDLAARLFAATGGDDYALLAALPPELDPVTLSLPSRTRISRVGSLTAGKVSLSLTYGGEPVKLPERLGFEHQGSITIAGFPLRQWLIGFSGLASGHGARPVPALTSLNLKRLPAAKTLRKPSPFFRAAALLAAAFACFKNREA